MPNRFAVFVLRVVLGLIFFAHGFVKLQTGLGQVAETFQGMGLPGGLAYIVAYAEVAGGLAMMIGIATKYVAGMFALLMLGAIFTVKLPHGLLGTAGGSGYEFDLLLLAVSIYFSMLDETGNKEFL